MIKTFLVLKAGIAMRTCGWRLAAGGLAACLFLPAGEAGAGTDGGAEAVRATLAAAAQAEKAAHRLATTIPGPATNAELELLLDAIDRSEEVIRATGRGAAFAESWYRIARCEFRCGRFWAAFTALERSYPEAAPGRPPPPARLAGRVNLEKRIADALYEYGRRPVPGARDKDAPLNGYAAAGKAYYAIVVNDRRHPAAPESYLRYAECAARGGDPEAAEKSYRSIFALDYPEHPVARQARLALARLLLDRHRARGADLPGAAREEIDALLRQAGLAENEVAAFTENRPPAAVAAIRPDVAALERERDEAAAGERLRQAQAFLTAIRTRESRRAGLSMLRGVVEKYPATQSAEVARSLLARHERQ